jgi:hypothetical protein
MMFAPVLPINYYPALDRGNYHLVQPHLFQDVSDEVVVWFRERGRLDGGHITILDNGVIELGYPDVDSLTMAAEMIEPDIIVVPDDFQNAQGTLRLLEETLPHMDEMTKHCKAVMIVPQGKSVAEWCLTAYNMIETCNSTGVPWTIGVPKVLDSYTDVFAGETISGRYAALSWLRSLNPAYLLSTHLLGVWDLVEGVEDVMRDFPMVMGLDTTLPFATAVEGTIISHLSPKVSIPEGWWTKEFDEDNQDTRRVVWQAEVNIAIVRQMLLSYRGLAAADALFKKEMSFKGLGQAPERL